MKELEVFYSYDDVLTLYEVLIVERHNERVLLEEVRGKRRL